MINAKYVDQIRQISEQLNEQKYGELFRAIYELARKQGGVRLNERSSIVFTTTPQTLCAAITNMIYEKFGKLVSMRSECKDITYFVSFELNKILTTWIVSPQIYKLIIKKDSAFLRPRAYMIVLYRDLYNPAKVEAFEDNKQLIKTLSKNTTTPINLNEISENISSDIIGGSRLTDILKNEVFIGIKAFNYLLSEPIEQFPYELISNNVDDTIERIRSKYGNINLVERDVPILNDIWLRRITVIKGSSIICYIYNSAEYELIPFYQSDVRIGSLYVVARFALINIWLMRVAYDKSTNAEKLKRIIHYYYSIHDRLIAMSIKNLDMLPAPLSENYYGVNISERQMLKQCEIEIDYKPYLFKKQHGHLLKFIKSKNKANKPIKIFKKDKKKISKLVDFSNAEWLE